MRRRHRGHPGAVRWVATAITAMAGGGMLGCAGPRAAAPTSVERLNGEGLRRLDRGDPQAAEETFRDALAEAVLVDDLKGQAEAWNNLGALAMSRGRPAQARGYHQIALNLHHARRVRDRGEVRTRANLGAALLALGKIEEAEAQFEAAVEMADEIKQPAAATLARVGLASVALYQDDARRAATIAQRAAADARQAGEDASVAAALLVEGAALERLGEPAKARVKLEQALELDRKREVPLAVAGDLRALARLAEREGDLAKAASYFARSARIAKSLGEFGIAEKDLRRAVDLARQASSTDADLFASELDALRATHTERRAAPGPLDTLGTRSDP